MTHPTHPTPGSQPYWRPRQQKAWPGCGHATCRRGIAGAARKHSGCLVPMAPPDSTTAVSGRFWMNLVWLASSVQTSLQVSVRRKWPRWKSGPGSANPARRDQRLTKAKTSAPTQTRAVAAKLPDQKLTIMPAINRGCNNVKRCRIASSAMVEHSKKARASMGGQCNVE